MKKILIMFGFLLSFCSIANAETYNLQNKTIDSDLNDVVRYNDHEYGIWSRLTTSSNPEFFKKHYQDCNTDETKSGCQTYIKEGKNYYSITTLKALTKVNLETKSDCTLAIVYYDSQGNVLYSGNPPDGKCEYAATIPNTHSDELLKFILKNKVKIDKLNKYGK